MATFCPNCGRKLTCGCQKAVASDGKAVCTSCVSQYNISLRKKKVSVLSITSVKLNKHE